MYKIILFALDRFILIIMITINLFFSATKNLFNYIQNSQERCDIILFNDYMNIDVPEYITAVECEIKELFPTYLTENEFHYKAGYDYILFIQEYNAFPEESDLNEEFHEIPSGKNNSIYYIAIIYPYIHDIYFNTQTMEVKHFVTGFRD